MQPSNKPSTRGERVKAKRELIHDLQTFLWLFEQEGYTKSAMQDLLGRLKRALEEDAHAIGGNIESHMKKMIRDCQFFAKGQEEPKQILRDLDQLRRDLEE